MSCYMCGEAATSVEHAPPRCFFPAKKDVADGTDYRKNLITVPSCATHNTAMSTDDEYALAVIAAHCENNPVAGTQYGTKIKRALERSEPFVKTVFRDARQVTVAGRPAYAFRLDDARFERVMEKVARAIYFDETGEKWTDPIRIHATGLRLEDMTQHTELQTLRWAGREMLRDSPLRGENPAVFRYQIGPRATDPFRLVRMEFYEGFEVFAFTSPATTSG